MASEIGNRVTEQKKRRPGGLRCAISAVKRAFASALMVHNVHQPWLCTSVATGKRRHLVGGAATRATHGMFQPIDPPTAIRLWF